MEAYKICSMRDGKYYSWVIGFGSSMEHPAKVEYKLNQLVYPKDDCGPLSVFDSLESLLKCISPDQRYWDKIFKCECEPSDSNLVWFPGIKPNNLLLDGTILCDTIKLIEEVPWGLLIPDGT